MTEMSGWLIVVGTEYSAFYCECVCVYAIKPMCFCVYVFATDFFLSLESEQKNVEKKKQKIDVVMLSRGWMSIHLRLIKLTENDKCALISLQIIFFLDVISFTCLSIVVCHVVVVVGHTRTHTSCHPYIWCASLWLSVLSFRLFAWILESHVLHYHFYAHTEQSTYSYYY